MGTTDEPASQSAGAPFTRLVRSLPTAAPFIGPETLERARGSAFTLRLGANESSFGASPRALAAMRDALPRIAWYGDPEGYETRSAIAAAMGAGIGVEHIALGAGIDDLLGLFVRLYMEPGTHAVASLGAYPTFAYHVAGFGGLIALPLYRHDRNDLAALVDAARQTSASLVYLANPDNPTGSWLSGAEITAFRESLPPACVLLLDEAYIEFAPPEAQTEVDANDPSIIRLRTFSKAYGMAGARIGYALAAPETTQALDRIRLHFGVNSLAQIGAQAAIADQSYLAEGVAEVARGREEYAALARSLGLSPLPSATNFVSIDVGGVERARATVAALAAESVFIRMPGAPPLNRCIRVSVGSSSERALFAEVFRAVWPRIVAS